MRTKEEILDMIDGLGVECYRSETMLNQDRGHAAVAPGAAFIEAMKPFAESVLDLRDLIVKLTEGEDGQIIRAFIVGQLQLQKQDADWKATIVSRLISEIRNVGERASHLYHCARCSKEGKKDGPEWLCDLCKEEILFLKGKHDDAEPSEGSSLGDGLPDQDPDEAGPDGRREDAADHL